MTRSPEALIFYACARRLIITGLLTYLGTCPRHPSHLPVTTSNGSVYISHPNRLALDRGAGVHKGLRIRTMLSW